MYGMYLSCMTALSICVVTNVPTYVCMCVPIQGFFQEMRQGGGGEFSHEECVGGKSKAL